MFRCIDAPKIFEQRSEFGARVLEFTNSLQGFVDYVIEIVG